MTPKVSASSEESRRSNSRDVTPSELTGKQFVSRQRHEVGLGPDGPVMGRWRLSFGDQMFAWDHSDVRESGPYRLASDGILTTSLSGGIDGDGEVDFYDVDEKQVFWAGKWYELVNE